MYFQGRVAFNSEGDRIAWTQIEQMWGKISWHLLFNSCHDEFLIENIKMYLYFLLFLNAEVTQVVEIIPGERQGPI